MGIWRKCQGGRASWPLALPVRSAPSHTPSPTPLQVYGLDIGESMYAPRLSAGLYCLPIFIWGLRVDFGRSRRSHLWQLPTMSADNANTKLQSVW